MLDTLAYCLMRDDLDGIETEYMRAMSARRELPVSSCPKSVENVFYASGANTNSIAIEENESFKTLLDDLDEKARLYINKTERKPKRKSLFSKRIRLGLHGGEWCRVDTDGVFEYNGELYKIDENEIQYQPIETDYGDLYDMDRILASNGKFYDMNYDEVKVMRYR